MRISSHAAALLASVIAFGTALIFVVLLAQSEREPPTRCHAQLAAFGPRCCAVGQAFKDGHCVGSPKFCPAGWQLLGGPQESCLLSSRRIRIEGGTVQLLPGDWEAEGVITPRRIRVRGFDIDSTETTYASWEFCSRAGHCRRLPGNEPGLPVSSVSASEANNYCRFVGGRLPTGDEWLFAAMGSESTRYPWGQTGLVCRRATFGLEHGPCSSEATGPDLAGSRPDGATPTGILDLAGNVAEWTNEPNGGTLARGGSFRSRLAADLKTWAARPDPPGPDVGFRCAYPVPIE